MFKPFSKPFPGTRDQKLGQMDLNTEGELSAQIMVQIPPFHFGQGWVQVMKFCRQPLFWALSSLPWLEAKEMLFLSQKVKVSLPHNTDRECFPLFFTWTLTATWDIMHLFVYPSVPSLMKAGTLSFCLLVCFCLQNIEEVLEGSELSMCIRWVSKNVNESLSRKWPDLAFIMSWVLPGCSSPVIVTRGYVLQPTGGGAGTRSGLDPWHCLYHFDQLSVRTVSLDN